MKNLLKIRIIPALAAVIGVTAIAPACLKKNEFLPEPVIEFLDYKYKDSIDALGGKAHLGVLTFSFTDGDGDMGLTDSDTAPPLDFNVYVNQMVITDGETQFYTLKKFRVPYITPEGQNKSLKGEIDLSIDISKKNFTAGEDTIFYELYILDRGLNKSNIITTPSIPVNL